MATDPVLIAYTAKRSKTGKRAIWTRIGHAYPHEAGAGLTVMLDAMPLDGRIVLLELDDADDERVLDRAAKLGDGKTAARTAPTKKKMPPAQK